MMRLGEDRARRAACAMVDGAAAGRTAALRPTGRLARAAVAVCIVALLAVACVLGAPRGAWADDDNLVNPQQRPDSSFIYDTAISALNSADTYYDNQTVQVVGEATGDIINADIVGDHKWVNLSSEEQGVTYSIAVYMRQGSAARIDTLGGYGKTGTTLQVRGTFHLVCPDHEGVTDIHADVVSVVDSGSQHPDEFSPQAFIPGAVAVAIGFVLMFVFYRLRERQR